MSRLGKAIGHLPLVASLLGVACASARPAPAVTPPASSAAVAAQPMAVRAAAAVGGVSADAPPVQVAVEAKGKRLVLTLPDGFTRDATLPFPKGEVLVASATRPGKYGLQISYDPDVSVTNARLPEFGAYLVSHAGQTFPTYQVESNGVVTDRPARIFFFTLVDVERGVMGVILIRSLAGSPLRVMIVGPRTADGERLLPELMKQMLDTLGAGES